MPRDDPIPNDNIVKKVEIVSVYQDDHQKNLDNEIVKREIESNNKQLSLCLHLSDFKVDLDDGVDSMTFIPLGNRNIVTLLLTLSVFISFYCVPNLVLDLTSDWGIMLQLINVVSAPMMAFFVIRATLGLKATSLTGNFLHGVVYYLLVVGYETFLRNFTDWPYPLPFRIFWMSVVWMMSTPALTYLMDFRSHSIAIKPFMWSFLLTQFHCAIFYLCLGFVFCFYYAKYSDNVTVREWSGVLQFVALNVYSFSLLGLKVIALDLNKFIKKKCGVLQNDDSFKVIIETIVYQYLCDFLQNFFIIMMLPESTSITNIMFMLGSDSFATIKRAIMISPNARDYINETIIPKLYLPKSWKAKLRTKPSTDKIATFRESVKFGMNALAGITSSAGAACMLMTMYYGRNRSIFSMSAIPERTFLITLGTVVIDLIFTTISCIAVHRYYSKTHGIKPLYHACILVRDNLGYVVINMSLGLMWVQGLLGKHWTGVWFMKEWLMHQ